MSADHLMKMFVQFKNNSGKIHETYVEVDLLNNRVYFTDPVKKNNDTTDYDDLEQEILAYLRPVDPETPMVPELMQKINDVKSGKYKEKFELGDS